MADPEDLLTLERRRIAIPSLSYRHQVLLVKLLQKSDCVAIGAETMEMGYLEQVLQFVWTSWFFPLYTHLMARGLNIVALGV